MCVFAGQILQVYNNHSHYFQKAVLNSLHSHHSNGVALVYVIFPFRDIPWYGVFQF